MSTLKMHHHQNPLFLCLVVTFMAFHLLHPTSSSNVTTTSSPHGTLSISTSGNISIVTISNPPINLYDANVAADMVAFISSLQPANRTTPPPKVVIFRSDNPDFFIAHLDLSAFLLPTTAEKTALLGQYVGVANLLRSLTTTVFIAEVDGEAFGAGNELIVQMDMRFAGPKARVGSPETSLGITHGGGGMQFLGRLINKGRAMQYLLSGDSADCKTLKQLGWFNECFKTKKQMEATVLALAERIALRPAAGLNATKVGLQSLDPSAGVLQQDLVNFQGLTATSEAQELIAKFIALGKNQTRSPFELGLPSTLGELFD